MNKEQIQKMAKEFSFTYGNGLYDHPGTIEFAAKFLQSLIEQGEVVEAEKYNSLSDSLTIALNSRDFNKTRADGYFKIIQEFNEIHTTPAKVIRDEEVEKYINKNYPMWRTDFQAMEKAASVRSVIKWMREQLIINNGN